MSQKRFNTLVELGKLIPFKTIGVAPMEEFKVSEEEKDHYISLLTEPAQEYLKRTGAIPLFRGVKLVINEKR